MGFAAKAACPRLSLGTSFLAAQFVDLLWPSLLILGLETVRIAPGATVVTPLDFVHYPLSHSLLAVAGWASAVALVYEISRRYLTGAVVVWIAVVSHWVLDAIVHRPDLPLYPGGPVVGLGLWASLPGTLAVELSLFGVGLWLYSRATVAKDRTGQWALWGLAAFLIASYSANLFGPPPPSVTAVAVAGHAQWLLVAWGYWLDSHRGERDGRSPAGRGKGH